MSHTVKIETVFSDLNILKSALESKGWSLVQKQLLRSYHQHDQRPYSFVAVNPDQGQYAYDIGIEVKGEKLELFGDFFGGSLMQTLGENLSELKKEYAYKTIEDEFAVQGYFVSKTVNANGTWTVEAEHA